VPHGAVKWATRRSGPRPIETESKRRPIRAALRSRLRVALGDESGHPGSERAQQRPRFRCAGCGYGIVAGGALPRCPMCKTSDWVPSESR